MPKITLRTPFLFPSAKVMHTTLRRTSVVKGNGV
jgi:hypothetical protein